VPALLTDVKSRRGDEGVWTSCHDDGVRTHQPPIRGVVDADDVAFPDDKW
jgi:hypothetical protein